MVHWIDERPSKSVIAEIEEYLKTTTPVVKEAVFDPQRHCLIITLTNGISYDISLDSLMA